MFVPGGFLPPIIGIASTKLTNDSTILWACHIRKHRSINANSPIIARGGVDYRSNERVSTSTSGYAVRSDFFGALSRFASELLIFRENCRQSLAKRCCRNWWKRERRGRRMWIGRVMRRSRWTRTDKGLSIFFNKCELESAFHKIEEKYNCIILQEYMVFIFLSSIITIESNTFFIV